MHFRLELWVNLLRPIQVTGLPNFFQVWTPTGLIIAHEVMENPDNRAMLDKALITRAGPI